MENAIINRPFSVAVTFIIIVLGVIIINVGIYIFSKEKKNITNTTFFVIAMACGMWEFSMGMLNISSGFNNHIVAYGILIATIIILPASVIYMFCIADFPPLVIKIHIIILGVLAIAALISLFLSYSPAFIDRFWGESISYANLKKNTMDKVYQYQLICGLIFISGCLTWSRKERLKRIKAQIKFLYLYAALVVFAYTVSILIPAIFKVSSNPLGSIYMFAGFVALTYYSNKTRAFSFSMESISDDIMKNVVMPLIVLDGDGELIIANKAATCLFGLSVEELKKVTYQSLFTEESMRNYHATEDPCFAEEGEGNLVIKNGNIPVKVTSTVMRDEYNDILYSLSYFTDFSKEQELMDKLEESRLEAENANKAKGDFLANMSHEIRTPINAVLGLDEMIIRECKDEDIRTYAFDIKSAGKTLLGLVNDVLDFSKIESNKMEIIPVEYELSSVINDLLNMITVKTAEKKLFFDIDVEEKIPHLLYGDEIRIKQVILNILTNAVKYTEKGSVSLAFGYEAASDNEIELIVKVKDTGIGIRKEDMQALFSPFERIDEKRNRTVEGTGLGMSITTQLLIMMGSELEVESAYGEGSEFSFRLKQKVIDWKEIGNFAKMYNRIREEGEKYRESFRAPEAKLLVVDDTAMNLTVIKGLLKRTQLQIDTAGSGKECLDKITLKKYDIIFLDQRMPEMDGIETFHYIKQLTDNLNTDTPVIALTANAVSGAREMFLREGFSDYLSKPVDAVKLERLIKKYLPPELVLKAETLDSEQEATVAGNVVGQSLREIEGIDIPMGIQACGSEETFRQVLKEFFETIEGRADMIEDYLRKADTRNYTIQVHALKSSARLIGALKLSEEAKYLEECGNREDIETITQRTGVLVSQYRGYRSRLEPLFTEEDTEERPVIEDKAWKEALSALSEFVEAFDFDSADSVMQMLNHYRIPVQNRKVYERLKSLLAEVARDDIMELINTIQ